MEANSECLLCSSQKACSRNHLFLYATTPILQDIVASHLQKLGAAFQLEGRLFRLEGDTESVIQKLRDNLSDAERADIRVSHAKGPELLAAPTLEVFGKSTDTAWFDEAIQSDRYTTHFQPIVSVEDKRVFAHECLIRLFADRSYNGGEIMDAAMSRGRIHLFDSYARRLSMRMAGRNFRQGTKVFVNFMPSSIYDPAYCMKSTLEEMSKTSIRPEDVVFEVVESDLVRDVKHLRKICDYYREGGFGFALDDLGSGSNSFQMMCDLRPDYVKVDKSLISNIHEPMYRTAVTKLREFAGMYGIGVIAEGVETKESVERLTEMGIGLMQGYYFGRPASQMFATNDLIQLSQAIAGPSKADLPTCQF